MRLAVILIGLVTLFATTFVGAAEVSSDSLWTIYCQSFSGPARVSEAKVARERMMKSSGMSEWYVVHQAAESTLFYGHYRSTDSQAEDGKDRRDAERAHADLKKIQKLQDEYGDPLFSLTVFVPTPQPGDEGPPEWDLKKVSADKFWTLYIGVYKDNPQRKKACVDAVRALREAGQEAYYYHDAMASMVCLGAWPRSAATEPREAKADPDKPDQELIAIGVPVPEKNQGEFMTSDGRSVKIVASNAKILDEQMQKTIDLNPYFMTNGVYMATEVKQRDGTKKLVEHHSQLLMIPSHDRQANGQRQAPPPDIARQIAPAPRVPSGAGGLKRLKENNDE